MHHLAGKPFSSSWNLDKTEVWPSADVAFPVMSGHIEHEVGGVFNIWRAPQLRFRAILLSRIEGTFLPLGHGLC